MSINSKSRGEWSSYYKITMLFFSNPVDFTLLIFDDSKLPITCVGYPFACQSTTFSKSNGHIRKADIIGILLIDNCYFGFFYL